MVALLVTLSLAQEPSCSGEAASAAAAAAARADVLDLTGATERFRSAAVAGCLEAELPALYLSGLLWAREASRQGGSPESLVQVREVVATLAARANELPVTAEIARVILLAAIAASQSERDEMALLLAHALRLEELQRAANQPLTPVVTAHEIAGDLWLQVHQYEAARRAYQTAAERIGATPRVMLGLARAGLRLGEVRTACGEYQKFLDAWGARPDDVTEANEAREFVRRPACRP